MPRLIYSEVKIPYGVIEIVRPVVSKTGNRNFPGIELKKISDEVFEIKFDFDGIDVSRDEANQRAENLTERMSQKIIVDNSMSVFSRPNVRSEWSEAGKSSASASRCAEIVGCKPVIVDGSFFLEKFGETANQLNLALRSHENNATDSAVAIHLRKAWDKLIIALDCQGGRELMDKVVRDVKGIDEQKVNRFKFSINSYYPHIEERIDKLGRIKVMPISECIEIMSEILAHYVEEGSDTHER
jgi:hypothetical protein